MKENLYQKCDAKFVSNEVERIEEKYHAGYIPTFFKDNECDTCNGYNFDCPNYTAGVYANGRFGQS